MDSIKYPRGLIRYSSEHELHGDKRRWYKPKNLGYAVAITLVVSLLVWSVATRNVTDMSVNKIRQPLYVTLSDGTIQNRYELKITNKSSHTQAYKLSIEGLSHAELEVGHFTQFELKPSETVKLHASIKHIKVSNEARQIKFNFVVESLNSTEIPTVRHKAVFTQP